mmetsp:Transcript_5745/g.22513  ORF Transcript_5745/g.22513 Transcript_5745/m.22513 type:complete len:223 (-) Transcript_5745:107-775(-)
MTDFLQRLGLVQKPDPKEEARKWKREMTRQQRVMDREILSIQREEQKMLKEVKRLAEKGHATGAKHLAKNIVQARNTMDRLRLAKTQMNSVSMQLQSQLAVLRVSGAMNKSAEVMQQMNDLVKLPELRETMTEMAREMERAGLIEELTTDALESLDDPSTEEQADQEVDRVLLEITGRVLDDLGEEAKGTQAPTATPAQTEPEQATETDPELEEMKARLGAL